MAVNGQMAFPNAAAAQEGTRTFAQTIHHKKVDIATATGFALQKNQRYYLITNRHVVLHCSEDRDPSNVGGWLCATNLQILQNKAAHPGEWVSVHEELYDANHAKRWIEHPTLPGSADLVALPPVCWRAPSKAVAGSPWPQRAPGDCCCNIAITLINPDRPILNECC